MSAGRHITQRSNSEMKPVLSLSEGYVMKALPQVACAQVEAGAAQTLDS